MKQQPKIIIAIDGYSSTGKSSFAKLIAEKLDYIHLDSGALYRAMTLYGLRKGAIGGGKIDEAALVALLPELEVSQRPDTFIFDENVEGLIRQMEVSSYVSPVSAIAAVRAFVDDNLHKMASGGGVVMDGRDIGTTVFPNAELKIFMQADDLVRAMRRYREMDDPGTTFIDVLHNLRDRDQRDSTREISPLRKADDAIVLDNTCMTMEDEIEWLVNLLNDKYGFSL
ncbi:MAG: (d)CMP kinase [Bacteroidales bacterium]|nr:(d)CMP kinase [Bacteroidales bacterium]